MNFFKSVFSDDTTPPESSKSGSENPEPDPDSSQKPSAWSFGGLIKTLATKSESVIENYRRDFEEFGSGLRKETAVIRDVASRAVKDLPASFEAGASVAQESLETVGQAIDDIGATVWKSTAQIISHGRESILAVDQLDHDSDSSNYANSTSKVNSFSKRRSFDVKQYSRFEMQLRAIQGNLDTYCTEPEEKEDFQKWRLGFSVMEEKKEETETLINENVIVREVYNEVVPNRLDEEGFWSRYFYRVQKLKQAEEARAMLVKRAISGQEEEDLSWDFDDDGEEEENGDDQRVGDGSLLKGESIDEVELENGNAGEWNDGNLLKGDSGDAFEKEKIENLSEGILAVEKTEAEKIVVVAEGKRDIGGSCKDSDVSVVSSQSLPEEDLGWDQIEDIGSNDENKRVSVGSRTSADRVDLRKRLNAAEEEEDLSWDIEDEDNEPVKS